MYNKENKFNISFFFIKNLHIFHLMEFSHINKITLSNTSLNKFQTYYLDGITNNKNASDFYEVLILKWHQNFNPIRVYKLQLFQNSQNNRNICFLMRKSDKAKQWLYVICYNFYMFHCVQSYLMATVNMATVIPYFCGSKLLTSGTGICSSITMHITTKLCAMLTVVKIKF